MVFFKVFLELDCKNMLNYLVFDSRSIMTLLSEKNQPYFSNEFPLFFKNMDGQSAIDVALAKNNIRTANLILEYICKYQNSYIYSHLFQHNLIELMTKGVYMFPLLSSNIIVAEFMDIEGWPEISFDHSTVRRPFNGGVFDLRGDSIYHQIFKSIASSDAK